eukprot:TRINITY_DN14486_c0_g1_i1.p2 TRINITY_DN14486_c0_g1~~TRINITY_DN14486_c0_g1_i1.p2  ORF type:complete len:271 (+),score=-23.91 TRINITY_DN14486_c0_g1_i1:866-1678(+)
MKTVYRSENKKEALPARHVFLVASGKGGVGKSTVAVNMARTWKQQGLRVGLLDADVYGPNQAALLGAEENTVPVMREGRFEPPVINGIFSMSAAYLVDSEVPLIWRGPMVSQLVERMLFQTHWPELDVCVIDLPPGTGDIALTIAKKLQVEGAVIVMTAEELAFLDARKAVNMFQKVEVPVLGVLANMAQSVCAHCGELNSLFSGEGVKKLCDEQKIPLLAEIPFQKPSVISEPPAAETERLAGIYEQAANTILSIAKKQARRFPKIVVE